MIEINEKTTIEEMGAIVCQALKDHGIDAFLSGGAVVSIYTENKYESFDLDFVSLGDRKKIKAVMETLGFKQDRSRLFIHPHSKYYVEFPGSSIAIGEEIITEFSDRVIGGNHLKLLTPTDCIKDRLAAFIHWKDKQGLEQAVLVAQDQPYNLERIRLFCVTEGSKDAFEQFHARLKIKK